MSSASLASFRSNFEASTGSPASPAASAAAASTTPQTTTHQFAHRTVETQGSLLGLATPASRPQGDTAAFGYLKKRTEDQKSFTSTQESAQSTEFDSSSMDFILNFDEPLLPSRRHLILQVFSAIDNVSDLQVSSAALRIITAQSGAVQFEPDSTLYGVAPSRIFSILQEEPGALSACMARFRRRLEREETETVQVLADGRGFSGVLGVSGLLDGSALSECSADVLDAFGLTNLIRLQIVNFLAGNIQKRSYNLAHYLLGLNESREMTESAFKASCLPLLIDMLTYGLGHPSTEVPVLFTEHPALGAKSLQLLNSLLPASQSVWKYLREERGLFASLAKDFGVSLLGGGGGDSDNSSTTLLALTYALLQRSELFRLLALDIHEASSGDDVRYAASVIEGLLADSKQGADCRLIAFLAAIDDFGKVNETSSNTPFESAVKSEFLAALIAYTETWSLLTGRVLSLESTLTSDSFDPLLGASLSKLRNSLEIWLSRMLIDATMPAECIESLVQLSVNVSSVTSVGSVGSVTSVGSIHFTSTYADTTSTATYSSLLSSNSITTALLRPDLSSSARCFLYTALMKTEALTDDALFKAIQIACKDVLSAGRDEFDDSVVTVAAGCLESLLLSAQVPSHFSGLLISSLLMEDAGFRNFLPRGSAILKWKAKWSLLMALRVFGDGTGESQDSQDCSFLSKLSCMGSVDFLYRALEEPDVYIHLLLPVLKFAALCTQPFQVDAEFVSKLLGKFRNGFVMDSLLLSLINRRQLTSPAFTPEILKITLAAINTFVRGERLGSSGSDDCVISCLTEAFAFLSASVEGLAAVNPDFSSTSSKLSLGHLCLVLPLARGCLLEGLVWLVLGVLQERLGFLLPKPGQTAIYLNNGQGNGNGNWRALRSEARVLLLPLLRSGEGIFVDIIQERIKQLISLDGEVTKKPIIQL